MELFKHILDKENKIDQRKSFMEGKRDQTVDRFVVRQRRNNRRVVYELDPSYQMFDWLKLLNDP